MIFRLQPEDPPAGSWAQDAGYAVCALTAFFALSALFPSMDPAFLVAGALAWPVSLSILLVVEAVALITTHSQP